MDDTDDKMAARVSILYFLAGTVWKIGFTAILWRDSTRTTMIIDVGKGIGFLVITACLLYFLIGQARRDLGRKNQAILELHNLLRGILDGSQDLFAAWDRNRRFTALNPRFQDVCEQLFGCRPHIGSPMAEVFGRIPRVLVDFEQCWDRASAGEHFVELQEIASGGASQWYEISCGPLIGRGGIVEGGFHIIRDTTARRRSEEALLDREQRLNLIIDNLADYVAIVDSGMRFRYLSAGAQRAIGAPPESVVGRSLSELVHPDDWPSVRAAVEASIGGGRQVRGLEFRCRQAAGQWRWHFLNGNTLRQHGEPVFLGVVQDIEERKRTENRLMHATKLSTVGELTAGLAHELAHPVAVIRLAAESALATPMRRAEERRQLREQLELIEDQAVRMASLIEHIRTFSHRRDGAEAVFDVLPALSSASRLIGSQLGLDGISLAVDFPEEPQLVTGSPVRLEQVVLNLVSNARAAVLARKRAEDGAYQPRISLACRCAPGWLRIEVGDNGPGVAPADRERLFEPFFTTKGVGGGLGLGLSISLTIARSMGGTLDFTSEPGQTLFALALPVVAPATDMASVGRESTPIGQ